MKALRGLGTALITPFKEDFSVDYDALERLIEYQIAGGADYLVVLGTTGESATLTTQEKADIRRFAVLKVAGRIPLVLGMGGNYTAALCHELQHSDLTGYTALLSVCPYYNKPSQEGLYQHFCAVAQASPLPILLYNVPGRTGVNLLPETVMRIREANHTIIGIKEASGNIEQIRRLITLREANAYSDFLVISGDDGIARELMEAGADGLISVASNAFPEDFREIVHNRMGKGSELQKNYEQLVFLLFKEGSPAGIKTVLNEHGFIHNILRLPLVSNSPAVRAQIKALLN